MPKSQFMLEHISKNIKNGTLQEIELANLSSGQLTIEYTLGYGKGIENGIEWLIIEPFAIIYLQGMSYGFLAIENCFKMPLERNPVLVYEAIDKCIKELNIEFCTYANEIAASDFYEPFICPKFEDLEDGIIKRIFLISF